MSFKEKGSGKYDELPLRIVLKSRLCILTVLTKPIVSVCFKCITLFSADFNERYKTRTNFKTITGEPPQKKPKMNTPSPHPKQNKKLNQTTKTASPKQKTKLTNKPQTTKEQLSENNLPGIRRSVWVCWKTQEYPYPHLTGRALHKSLYLYDDRHSLYVYIYIKVASEEKTRGMVLWGALCSIWILGICQQTEGKGYRYYTARDFFRFSLLHWEYNAIQLCSSLS